MRFFMTLQLFLMALFGIIVGLGASFSGLGGGFLMVPLLMFMGYSAPKAVGTSFMAILVISVSALVAHGRLAHVDYKTGIILGIGGIIGAQIGSRLIDYVSTGNFKKIFAGILVCLAAYLFFQK
ncbi:MAG: sulfite exporter TauE/SafE family protein [Desulfobaccales bacterium]